MGFYCFLIRFCTCCSAIARGAGVPGGVIVPSAAPGALIVPRRLGVPLRHGEGAAQGVGLQVVVSGWTGARARQPSEPLSEKGYRTSGGNGHDDDDDEDELKIR